MGVIGDYKMPGTEEYWVREETVYWDWTRDEVSFPVVMPVEDTDGSNSLGRLEEMGWQLMPVPADYKATSAQPPNGWRWEYYGRFWARWYDSEGNYRFSVFWKRGMSGELECFVTFRGQEYAS